MDMTANLRQQTLALIKRQKTMVLATGMDNLPWAAAVYYIYFSAGFYFFSSPRSLHIQHIKNCTTSAAAIYVDGERLEQLEGVQMSGRVERIDKPLLKLSVAARYLLKFPLAKPYLSGQKTTEPDLRSRVELYVFLPNEIFYMNHQMGFGSRIAVKLNPAENEGN